MLTGAGVAAGAPRIVLYEPRPDDLDVWPDGVDPRDARIELCRVARDAVRSLLADATDAALVARIHGEEPEVILLLQVARMCEPPVPVVVLTTDPERARTMLSEQGVTAEVLRAPATIADLVLRLGARR